MEDELRQAVIEAAGRADVLAAVEAIYQTLADEIAMRRPICNTSGRCCRFEEYGHRLYVSTIELARFHADLATLKPPVKHPVRRSLAVVGPSSDVPPAGSTGCPYQYEGLCTIHAARPFGCRIFFCDQTSTAWQHQLYERLHGRFRALHDELGVPYHYVEWRFALGVLGLRSL